MCAFLRDGGDKTNSGIRCIREICLNLCDKLWGGRIDLSVGPRDRSI